MPGASMAEHKIFPHGKLEALAPNLWQVRGSMSFPLRRNMTVYRLPDGTLVLYSVVAMDDEGMKALEALGRPAVMVIPHSGHLMDAGFYRKRYPDLKVACPPQAKKRAEERCGRVDGTPEELLRPLGIKVHPVHGTRQGEFALEVEVPGGAALVTNDVVGGRSPDEKPTLLMRIIGPPAGHRLAVARIFRVVMVHNKVDLRGWLHLMAENSKIKVITASHAPPVDSDCAEALRDAATTI
jgi:hypothetical protein